MLRSALVPDGEDRRRSTVKVVTSAVIQKADGTRRDRPYLLVLAGGNVGEMHLLDGDRERVIGRNPECELRIQGDGVSRRHARITTRDGVSTIEDLGSTNGTWVNDQPVEFTRVLVDGDKLQLGGTTVLKFSLHDAIEENFQRQMYESALRDGLTQIFNKRYFLDRLDAEFAFFERHQSALSLTMFDIDLFKSVNDTWGHLAGDEMLRALASAVNDTIRQEDVFARYGGEEFAVLSREIDLKGARSFGERLRKVVEKLRVTVPGAPEPLGLTISVGVASLPDPSVSLPVDLIENADRALYRAKREGRNRVVVHESVPAQK